MRKRIAGIGTILGSYRARLCSRQIASGSNPPEGWKE
jgi:hypothetical protein